MRYRLILFFVLAAYCAGCGTSSFRQARTFLATSQADTSPTDLSKPQLASYFPPSFLRRSISCGMFSRSVPIISDIEDEWYPSQLSAAKEPKLYPVVVRPRKPGTWALRFTWLRSFHPPIFIRIEGDQNDQTLVAKQLSGAGGYDPGRIAVQLSRHLTPKETQALRSRLSQTHVFDLPMKSCVLGLDGAEWLIEGVDDNGYHFVDRWSPEKGGVRDLGTFLLSLTGWQIKEIY